MSFIVSFNGQFKNYKLPDLSHYDNVRHIYRANKGHPVATESTFTNNEVHQHDELEYSRKRGVKAYQHVDKEYHTHKKSTLARDICSAPVHYLYSDQSYDDVLELMMKYSCRHVPIMSREEVLVGIVSHTDMLQNSSGMLVDEFMTKEVLTALETTRIQDLAKIMLHKKFGALPIINSNHFLIGIVTLSDILYFVTASQKLEEFI
jgi:CBS domain-containing protein